MTFFVEEGSTLRWEGWEKLGEESDVERSAGAMFLSWEVVCDEHELKKVGQNAENCAMNKCQNGGKRLRHREP